MPEIIPNTPKHLKISHRVLKRQEDYLVFLREGGSRLRIVGLREWLRQERRRRKKGTR